MWLIILNAVVFAILLVLVVVPPLFIYDSSKHGGESLGPPSAGEVIPSDSASHSVKQKLYMLFMIPACACTNVIFFYFTYYRPMRYVVFRVEQNTLSLYQNRLYGDQLLRNVGINVLPTTNGSTAARHRDGTSLPMTKENVSVVASNAAAESSNYRIHLALRSHARPKSVRKDSYVSAAVLPEIQELRDAIEKNFLKPSELTEKNFLDAVHAAVDGFMVIDPRNPMLTVVGALGGAQSDNVYLSSRPPLAVGIGKGPTNRPKRRQPNTGFDSEDEMSPHLGAEPFRRAHRSMVMLVSDLPAGGRPGRYSQGDSDHDA